MGTNTIKRTMDINQRIVQLEELADKVIPTCNREEPFTLHMHYADFMEVIANIILATSNVVRDVVNSENTIDCFKSTFQHYLPKELADMVEKLLMQEAINQCDRQLLPVDNSKRL